MMIASPYLYLFEKAWEKQKKEKKKDEQKAEEAAKAGSALKERKSIDSWDFQSIESWDSVDPNAWEFKTNESYKNLTTLDFL